MLLAVTTEEPAIGRRVRRSEDEALVTGRGRYAADPALEGLAHLAVFRSPFGRARIDRLDLSAARAHPGVLAAWSAADLPELAGDMEDPAPRHLAARSRPLLAGREARYQGEALAVIVAETPYAAADALELVEAELEPLPAAATLDAALAEGAPRVHDDLESNVAGVIPRRYGDIQAAFAPDSVVTGISLDVPRISGGYMEPRALTAAFEDGRLTLWASTQWVFGVRDKVAGLLGLDRDRVRVLAVDVGGGFGPKGELYPEETLVALAAMRLGRPVRWVASRTEDTQVTAQGHGTRAELEIAAAADGTLRGIRGRFHTEAGAYAAAGAGLAELIMSHLLSMYRLPALDVETAVVYTNAVPTGFVRGGARPVGNFAVERLMDQLARRLGRDPVDLRRQNLVPPEAMPYDTGLPAGRHTAIYDGGDYPRLLAAVEEALGDVREGPREDGRLVGRGVVCCVESSGFGGNEPARVRLERDGVARLFVGSTPQGQGHRTVAAQVLADRLGWPLERIVVTAADTAGVEHATMTAGSRTAVQVGNATALAGRAMRRRLLEQAAETLEADPADLVLTDGVVAVRGAPGRSVDVREVIPEAGLEVLELFTPPRPLAYSSGCHGAVVAVDPDTGSVEIERYVIAHDTGRPINPMLVEGQMQGGYAHGVGYALFEEDVYSPDGSLLSASFLDYSVPGPPELATVPELRPQVTPTDANPEGIKGAGESGTVPVPAAICAAVERALSHVRPEVAVGRLPLAPERVLKLARGG
jgi:aerobic carbon-monoxide dehydrogenase large subunit